jgi:superoxide dismutase, Fe-Mn family
MLNLYRPWWNTSAFEPQISTLTLDVHINSLHQGYVDKLNKRLGNSELLSLPPSEVLSSLRSYMPRHLQEFYRNMMGGNVTHTLFWQVISPTVTNLKVRDSAFLSDFRINPEALRKEIVKKGLARFGSGWVWGVLKGGEEFELYTTQNHDTPYMRKHTPLFCVDLWEHAYFLDDFGDRKVWLETITQYLDFKKIDEIYLSQVDRQEDIIDQWVLTP